MVPSPEDERLLAVTAFVLSVVAILFFVGGVAAFYLLLIRP